MKKKIKNWIKEVIGITALEDYISSLEKEIQRLSYLTRSHEKEITQIQKLTNVGIDATVNGIDMSWAVICIASKTPVVRFVHLPNDSAREVLRFADQFDIQNKMMLDGPTVFKTTNKMEII